MCGNNKVTQRIEKGKLNTSEKVYREGKFCERARTEQGTWHKQKKNIEN